MIDVRILFCLFVSSPLKNLWMCVLIVRFWDTLNWTPQTKTTLNQKHKTILTYEIDLVMFVPPVEVSLMGGTGGCMLGGSEDDLWRPTRSKEPGFQLLDAED